MSRLLAVYEKLDKMVDREVVVQYIQHPQIARDFANYLELFYKYRTDYQIDAVLSGHIDDILVKKAAHASFDERLGVTGLLLSRLNVAFRNVYLQEMDLESLFGILSEAKEALLGVQKEQPFVYLEDAKSAFAMEYSQKKKAGLLSREDAHHYRNVLDTLGTYLVELRKADASRGEQVFDLLKQWFGEKKAVYDRDFDHASAMLEYAFDFMEAAFGGGQELVVFITELNTSQPALHHLQQYSCERYYRYNQTLLCHETTRVLLERIRDLG